ncbi:universal stress protein [Streptomyces finlayi]|uniref:Universal stress protein n=1 Tax=Streptomyces finlayi TaxID=67296 RepID=A0A7G7BDG5_9ACTN|nr:universal stress protein [Streptomyces finlayi]QNE73380.1 universal stress protein [Streptomyces finlayi]
MNMDAHVPRIVVGVDGSASSKEALRWAARHAQLIGGVVDAVSAWDTPSMSGWSGPATDPDFDVEAARTGLAEEIRSVFGDDRPVGVRELLVRGNPTEVLLSEAEGAELLVVGSRGRGGFARALLGSVSQQCAQHATCPVVIVRPSAARA